MFMMDIDYTDPMNIEMLDKIRTQSLVNEEFYWKVFKLYPHPTLKTFSDINQIDNEIDEEYYYKHLDEVVGYHLRWPVDFLEEEKNVIYWR